MADATQTVSFTGAHGNKLVADSQGDDARDTVVFLHGGGQTRHAWGGTARRVAQDGWNTIAIDQRGHGESDWTEQYGYPDFAGDVVSMVQQLPAPPVLVGASLGGIAALFAQDTFVQANRSATLCRALVLVDIAPRTNPAGVERILSFMKGGMGGFATLAEAADSVAAYTRERRRAPSPDGLRKNLRQHADGRWYWHWDPRFLDGARNPSNRPSGLLEEMAARLTVPTLLIRGSKSDVLTDEGVEAFRRAVSHAQHVDVVGAGHMVAGDRNDAFTGAILTFLRNLHGVARPRS